MKNLLLALGILFLPVAPNSAFAECDDGDAFKVAGKKIFEIKKQSYGWDIDLADTMGECINVITSKAKPPANCRPGGKISAEGTVSLDYSTSLMASSVMCE